MIFSLSAVVTSDGGGMLLLPAPLDDGMELPEDEKGHLEGDEGVCDCCEKCCSMQDSTRCVTMFTDVSISPSSTAWLALELPQSLCN
jgi:hypothetical protein